MIAIREYDHERDADWLYDLWHRALNPMWSLSLLQLRQKLAASMLSLVAQQHGQSIGFCAVGHKVAGRTGLLAILVEPSYQRQGTGAALIAALESALRLEGITQLALGSGSANGYFWPGVPVCENAACRFFLKHGWEEKERSFDLLLDLSDYRTPSWVYSRLTDSGIELRLADSTLRRMVMHFERSWFPDWTMFFEEALYRSAYEDVLVAQAADGSIAGTVMLGRNETVTWRRAIGPCCGSFGALGVAKDHEGKSVGMALAARSAEILKERGFAAAYIEYTCLVSWYGKLGASVWAEYRMSRKQL